MTRHRITTAEYSALRKEAKENATLAQVVEEGTKASKEARAKSPGLGNEEFLARAKRIESAMNRASQDVQDAANVDEYSDLSKDELVELLKERELPHSGTKPELVARLQESDAEQAEDATQPEG
jgi:coenzyme F420-reducing hydrogenase alpha subunit